LWITTPNLRQWKSLTVELMHGENDQMLAVRSRQDDCVLIYAAYRRTLVAGALRTAGITELQDDPLAWEPVRPAGPTAP
jgi:hypothetical protein